jgi:hypothetical protein
MRLHTKITLPKAEMVEGTEAWKRFNGAMQKVIAVPHAEIQRRIAQERAESAKNPNRRGPKRKVKPSASLGPLG